MAPPTAFHIEVDHSDEPFFAGSTISGKVILQCPEDKDKVKEVTLKFVGRANVQWSESTYNGQQTIVIQRSASEEYFDISSRLWAPSDDKASTIPAGRYEFPFTFTLPSATMPSSYEYRGDQKAYIRYWLEARMVRQLKFDHVSKATISLLEKVDLNLHPDLLAPKREGYQAFPALCCKGGAVSVSVSVDRTGYCPGEPILINAMVENYSGNTINPLRAFLKRKTILFISGSKRQNIRHVAEIRSSEAVPRRGVFAWDSEPLTIPVCPPSSATCKLIHIEYFLEVFASITNSFSHVKVLIPITIGTVPLSSEESNVPKVHFAGIEAFNVADDKYTMGETQFAPLYPSLNLPLLQDGPH